MAHATRFGYGLLEYGQHISRMVPYERFEAWQKCHELVLAVYTVTEAFPAEERYGLVSQLRRAAFSAAVNIAEGSAKRGWREFRRYLDISIGSLSEVAYTLRVAKDLGHITHDQWASLDDLRDHAGRLTWRLYRSLTNTAEK